MPGDPVALRRAEMPVGSERLLETRSLAADHRRLAALLRPGMRVLDVGCGSGAITRGIAVAVSPGQVVGLDVSRHLLEAAAALSTDHPNLRFEEGSVLDARYAAEFDVVTAARVLQWLADPLSALQAMVRYTKPGGQVVVLDYNHRKVDVGDQDESESTDPSDPAYLTRAALWCDVAATRDHQMVADGALTEAERQAAETAMREWVERGGRQTLSLRACAGTR
jgi:2-polyprenyl-3-methyl-5-hydroxy-6-metoxy-1,4-benzoquinol methylase